MLHEELPLAVKKELDVQGLNGVPVLLSTSTDLSLSGKPRRHWIVATHANVAAVSEQAEGAAVEPTPRVESYVPVADVQEFRTQGAVGSGFLQAYVDDHWVDLARYSNAEADRFHRVARSLEELRTTGAIEIHEGESLQKTHCEKCDQRLPTPGEACPRCIPRKAIFGRLAQMLWPHRTTAAIMCGLMLVAVAAELAPPKLQQYLVDDILKGGQQTLDPQSLLTALFAVVSALALARIVLSVVNFAKGRLATRVGVALTFDLRAKLVEKLHTLGLGYYDRHQVGSITSRVAYDSEVIQSLLQQITGGFLLQIVQVTAVGVMLFTLNPKLAVYTLIPAPLVIAGSWFFWKRVHPKHYRYWDSSSKQAGMLTGMLSGIRVVKAFAQEDREYDRFNRISDYLRTSRIRVDYSTAAFSATMQLIFSLGGLIVWYVGGRDVLAGKMTLGSLMAFLAYLAMFYTPLATLSQFTTWLTNFLTGCQRVFELLDTPVESTDPAEPVDLPEVQGRIEFDKVTFGYERHQPVLRDVNFAIEPGETIGIVGKSGSGKTTLVNLLCRFYDVNEGRVLVDGVDVRQLASNQLRRQVGVVLQEPFMFRGTIWDNLVYGLPTSSQEQAIAAAKAAQSHEFILNSPLGYDTWLGERGAGLSGGERQRLSIARAILYDPPILVLDEATSSVDAESEQAIQQALKALTRGRTTIAIAHRLSTLRDAHRILVFDRGRLVEQGSHEQLIAENGRYAKLVRLQSQTSPKASIDDLIEKADDGSADDAKATAERDAANEAKKFLPKWLLPGDAEICAGARDTMTVTLRAPSSLPSPRWGGAGGGVTANGTRLDAASPLPNCCANSTALRSGDFGSPVLGCSHPHQGEGAGGLLFSHRGVFAVNLFPATNPEDYISLRVWTRDGEQQEVGILRNLKEWPAEAQRLVRSALDRRYFLQTIEGVDAINLELGHLHCDVRTPHGPRRFTMRWSQSQVQDFGERGKMLLDLDDNRFLVPDVQTLPPKERELFQRYVYW